MADFENISENMWNCLIHFKSVFIVFSVDFSACVISKWEVFAKISE